jgi:hypothetical protein
MNFAQGMDIFNINTNNGEIYSKFVLHHKLPLLQYCILFLQHYVCCILLFMLPEEREIYVCWLVYW